MALIIIGDPLHLQRYSGFLMSEGVLELATRIIKYDPLLWTYAATVPVHARSLLIEVIGIKQRVSSAQNAAYASVCGVQACPCHYFGSNGKGEDTP